MCSYVWVLIGTGFEHMDKWLLPIIYSGFYGVVCFIIFSVSIRLLKSELLFCVLSWVVPIVLLLIKLIGLSNSNLTYFEHGHYLYVDGKMTLMGFVYYTRDPLWAMAILSTFFLLRFKIKKHNHLEQE